MRISGWSSDVCSSDLGLALLDLVQRREADVDVAALDQFGHLPVEEGQQQGADVRTVDVGVGHDDDAVVAQLVRVVLVLADAGTQRGDQGADLRGREHAVEARARDVEDFSARSEEHTSELQSLMRISYAVFCLKKTNKKRRQLAT